MKQRLVYIDCLRGLAMLMVVYSHVLSFSMGGLTPSPIGMWMRNVMLPLFFFISGFCIYKNSDVTRRLTIKAFCHQIWSKTKTILIPTVVMFLLYMLYCHKDILHYATVYDKGGYWFTWVLFQILAFYYIALLAAGRVRNQLAKIAVLCLPLLLFQIFSHFVGFSSETAVIFEWVKVKQFYLFFLAGWIVRKYDSRVMNALRQPAVNLSLLVATVLIFNASDSNWYSAIGG